MFHRRAPVISTPKRFAAKGDKGSTHIAGIKWRILHFFPPIA
jgi:hypothetical protein